MRKGLGLLFAISLLAPMGIWAAGPAGSAANTVFPTCKSFTGTLTFTPGYPVISSKVLVKPVSKTVGAFTGCSGGGITKGTINSSQKAKVATNCKKYFADAAAHKPGEPLITTIKWSNGQTTTASGVITTTGVTSTAIKAKIVGKITAGLGKGKTSTINVLANPNANFCAKVAWTKTTFKSTSIVVK